MKSKIENNVLIKFNPDDLIDGFFESLEVTEIGLMAFHSLNITAISLPNVTKINDYAFYHCVNLTDISLPQAREIGKSAFYHCSSLTTISLPQVRMIGTQAFQECINLSIVSLPQAVELAKQEIIEGISRNRVFDGCRSLETITLHHLIELDEIFMTCMLLKRLIIIDTNQKIDRNDVINQLPKELRNIEIIIQSEQIKSLCNSKAVLEQNIAPDLIPLVLNFSKQLGFFRSTPKEQEQSYFNTCTLQ